MADMGRLTVTTVKNAHQGKHFDGGELFLLVKPNYCASSTGTPVGWLHAAP